ncbi:uncharacterized protein LOC132200758 [Neocloeon triangulifer]|uniref:uncharacterized protein LOC132200758 n=1 Tax=Neocloeon triangulifer TaxID=2078957 RepID=UPI00286FA13F|nr:uncharacterized protein LOC132200758 [Neocloeon triangulifer]
MAQPNLTDLFSNMSHDELLVSIPLLYAEAPTAAWRDVCLIELFRRMTDKFKSCDAETRRQGRALLELACLLVLDPATKVALLIRWLYLVPTPPFCAPLQASVAVEVLRTIVERYGSCPEFQFSSDLAKDIGMECLDVAAGGQGWRSKPLHEVLFDLSDKYEEASRDLVVKALYKTECAKAEALITDVAGLKKFIINTMMRKDRYNSPISNRKINFFTPRSASPSPFEIFVYDVNSHIEETILNVDHYLLGKLLNIYIACSRERPSKIDGPPLVPECVPSETSSDEGEIDLWLSDDETPEMPVSQMNRKRKALWKEFRDRPKPCKVARLEPTKVKRTRKQPRMATEPLNKGSRSSTRWASKVAKHLIGANFNVVHEVTLAPSARPMDPTNAPANAPQAALADAVPQDNFAAAADASPASTRSSPSGSASPASHPATWSPALSPSVQDFPDDDDDDAALSPASSAASDQPSMENMSAALSPKIVAAVAAAANAAAPYLQAAPAPSAAPVAPVAAPVAPLAALIAPVAAPVAPVAAPVAPLAAPITPVAAPVAAVAAPVAPVAAPVAPVAAPVAPVAALIAPVAAPVAPVAAPVAPLAAPIAPVAAPVAPVAAPIAPVAAPVAAVAAPVAPVAALVAPLVAPTLKKNRKARQQAMPYTRRSTRAAAQSATDKIHQHYKIATPGALAASSANLAPPAVIPPPVVAPAAAAIPTRPVVAPLAAAIPAAQPVAAPAPAPAANPLVARRPRRDWRAPPVLGPRRSTRAAAMVAKAKIHHCLERNANLATFVYTN